MLRSARLLQGPLAMLTLLYRASVTLEISATRHATTMVLHPFRVSACLDNSCAYTHDIFPSRGKAAHKDQLHNRGRGLSMR